MSVGTLKEARMRNASSAFAKKLLKLYPPMLLMLFVVTLTVFLFFKSQFLHLESDLKGALLSLNNYFQIFSESSYFAKTGTLRPLTHLWALSLEVQVYFLIYLFFYGKYRREKTFSWFVLLSVLTLLSYLVSVLFLAFGADFSRVYYGLFTRLYSFSLGAIASFFAVAAEKSTRASLKKDFFSFVLLILLIVPNFYAEAAAPVFYFGFFLYSLICSLLLILLSAKHSLFYRPLSAGIFRFLTSRAYHIYLWHFPIIAIEDRFFANRSVHPILYRFIFFTLCFFFSESSYRMSKRIFGGKKSKFIALIAMLLLSAVMMLIPYKKISENTEEYKAVEAMKEQILANEKKQKKAQHALENESKNRDALKKTLRQERMRRLRNETDLSLEQAGKEAPGQKEKPPLLLLALKHIDWVNGLGDEFLSLNPEEYETYKDIKGLLIGDSIASMSYHTLATYLPNFHFDSEHSRQVSTAYETFQKFKDQDFGEYLVLSLGTNGETEHADLDKIRKELNGKKMILISIVLPYREEEERRNESIRSYAAKYEDVYLVDWHKAAKQRPELFFDDKIHPGENGAKVYGQILVKKLIEIEKSDKTKFKKKVR